MSKIKETLFAVFVIFICLPVSREVESRIASRVGSKFGGFVGIILIILMPTFLLLMWRFLKNHSFEIKFWWSKYGGITILAIILLLAAAYFIYPSAS
ncbi:hypothetical protein C4J81_03515 [Deltaproteobacteria bacterium Smac51]|nr:hypothetical protein C4J81_03515 [Deltaproteobacteria bacterium Smac51]